MRCLQILIFVLSINYAASGVSPKDTLEIRLTMAQVKKGKTFGLTFLFSTFDKTFKLPRIRDFNPDLPAGLTIGHGSDGYSEERVKVDGSYKTRRIKKLKYTITAEKTGFYTIGPVQLSNEDGQLSSNSVTVWVHDLSYHKDRIFDIDAPLNSVVRAKPWARGDWAFLRTHIDRKEVYKGEALMVSINLYSTKFEIHNIMVDDIPLAGFTNYLLTQPPIQKANFKQEEILNGVKYWKQEIARIMVFAQQEGTVQIPSIPVRFKVVQSKKYDPSNPTKDIFSGPEKELQQYYRETATIAIQVKGFSRFTIPSDFTGAVGNFALSVMAKDKEVTVGTPFPIRIEATGEGNIGSFTIPEISLPSGLTIFRNELRSYPRPSAQVVRGKVVKTIELMTEKGGTIMIPAITFSYFDPLKEGFITRETLPIQLWANTATGGKPKTGREKANPIVTQLQRLKLNPIIIFIIGIGTMLCIILLIALVLFKSSKKQKHVQLEFDFKHEIEKLKALEDRNFLKDETKRIADGIFLSTIALNTKAMTTKEIIQELAALKLKPKTINEVEIKLGAIDHLSYSGGWKEMDIKDLKNELIAILKSLEKLVKSQ